MSLHPTHEFDNGDFRGAFVYSSQLALTIQVFFFFFSHDEDFPLLFLFLFIQDHSTKAFQGFGEFAAQITEVRDPFHIDHWRAGTDGFTVLTTLIISGNVLVYPKKDREGSAIEKSTAILDSQISGDKELPNVENQNIHVFSKRNIKVCSCCTCVYSYFDLNDCTKI